jgi:hypothetical protein
MLEIYVHFCNEYFPGVNLFPSTQTMIEHFISHLFVQNYQPSTIASFRIKKILKGTQNLRKSVETRMPISRDILFDLAKALPVVIRSVYDQILWKAMMTMAYFCFLLIGKMAIKNVHESHSNSNFKFAL